MKKIIFLLIVVMLLSGCDFLGTLKDINDRLFGSFDSVITDGDYEDNFVGGSSGLDFDFKIPSPVGFGEKMSFTAGNEMNVEVGYENKGESDINIGYICLMTGESNDYFDNWDGCECQMFGAYGAKMEGGKKKSGEKGEIVFSIYPKFSEIQTPTTIIVDGQILRQKDIPLIANAEYNYNSKAIVRACIEESTKDETRKCEVNTVSFFGVKNIVEETSSGPVKVDKVVQQKTSPDKILIQINIKNFGDGKVIPDLGSECASSVGEPLVQVTLYGTPSQYTCINNGFAKLTKEGKKDGEARITCSIEGLTGEGRKEPFGINLNYNYEEIKTTSFSLEETKY